MKLKSIVLGALWLGTAMGQAQAQEMSAGYASAEICIVNLCCNSWRCYWKDDWYNDRSPRPLRLPAPPPPALKLALAPRRHPTLVGRVRMHQPASLPAMRTMPIHSPSIVPRLVSMNSISVRATRLRYQPRSVRTSSRRARKSA